MGKVTSDYRKIMDGLDSLKGECMTGSGSETLQEAIDIISDYEKTVAGLNRMVKHYETPEKARRIEAGVYVCPACGKRVSYNHSHCHWCGKSIGWVNKGKWR